MPIPNRYELKLRPVSIGKRTIKTRRLPPSANARMCWQERARWNREWKEQTVWEIKASKIPTRLMTRIALTIYDKAIRCTDRDNLVAAMKPVIDALVAAEVIPDDDPSRIVSINTSWVLAAHKSEQSLILDIEDRTP